MSLLEALRRQVEDWRAIPRNGYDEEGRARHEIEVDCADTVEDILAEADAGLDADHAARAHYAQEVDCGDPACPLNWRQS